jgi:hypothetical protein
MHHTFILCSHSQGSTQPLPRHSTVLHTGSFREFINDTDQCTFKLGSFEFLEGSLLLGPFENTFILCSHSQGSTQPLPRHSAVLHTAHW